MGFLGKMLENLHEKAQRQQEQRDRVQRSFDVLKDQDDAKLKKIVKDDSFLLGPSSTDKAIAKELLRRRKQK